MEMQSKICPVSSKVHLPPLPVIQLPSPIPFLHPLNRINPIDHNIYDMAQQIPSTHDRITKLARSVHQSRIKNRQYFQLLFVKLAEAKEFEEKLYKSIGEIQAQIDKHSGFIDDNDGSGDTGAPDSDVDDVIDKNKAKDENEIKDTVKDT